MICGIGFADKVTLLPLSVFSELAKLCKSRLYSPENGRIDELLEAKPGVFSATFKCNLGYRMVGERRITCKNGNWETRVPWCKCKF